MIAQAGGYQPPAYMLIHQSSEAIFSLLVCEVSSFNSLTLQSVDTPMQTEDQGVPSRGLWMQENFLAVKGFFAGDLPW